MTARRRFFLTLAVSLTLAMAIAGGASGQSRAPDVSRLAGSWVWSWKGPDGLTHRHVLEVEGVGKALAAREIFDDQPPVKVSNLLFDGTAVKFTVDRGARRAEYSGKMTDADTIQGTVTTTTTSESREFTWKAERKKEPEPPKPDTL
jgi:hypothetical protein